MLLPGTLRARDTINLKEAVNHEESEYSTIASTMTTTLRSAKGTLCRGKIGLCEPIISVDIKPVIIISIEKLHYLIERAPLFPSGEDLVRTHQEYHEWRTYKEQLVSNYVFEHKRLANLGGPAQNPLLRTRNEIECLGLHRTCKFEPILPHIVQVLLPPCF